MIPFISYPEAMAKARVIPLKDQQKHIAKTLHKAGTLHVDINKQTEVVHRTILITEPITIYNLLPPINDNLRYIHSAKQTSISNDIKLIHSKIY